MLCSVGEGQIHQIGQVFEHVLDVEVGGQLSNDQAEHLVLGCLQFFFDFLGLALGFVIFKQLLNMRFNKRLLVAVAMLLPLDVLPLQRVALLLPVVLEFYVPGHYSYGQFLRCQFRDLFQNVIVLHACKFGISIEIRSNHFLSNFSQRLDLV